MVKVGREEALQYFWRERASHPAREGPGGPAWGCGGGGKPSSSHRGAGAGEAWLALLRRSQPAPKSKQSKTGRGEVPRASQ